MKFSIIFTSFTKKTKFPTILTLNTKFALKFSILEQKHHSISTYPQISCKLINSCSVYLLEEFKFKAGEIKQKGIANNSSACHKEKSLRNGSLQLCS